MYKPFLVILDIYQVLYSSVVQALYSLDIYQVLYSSAYTGTVQFQAVVLFSVYLIEEGLSNDKLRIPVDRHTPLSPDSLSPATWQITLYQ